MTEFTSLTCPNCGGALKAEIGARALRCSYCGIQHVIKDDSGLIAIIPDGVVCPICWKSDRAGSLPMILAHPTDGERATGLPKRLTMLPPEYYPAVEPEKGMETGQVNMPGDGLFWGSVILILIGILYFWWDIFLLPPHETTDVIADLCITNFMCFSGPSIWFYWFSIYFLNSDRRARQVEVNRQRQLAREYPEKLRRYQWELDQNRRAEHAYQAAREVWARLYYCGRDDCIYLPGEEPHAKPDQMVEFIKQHMDKVRP